MMKRKLLFSIVALLCSVGAWATYTKTDLTNAGWTEVTSASALSSGVNSNVYVLLDAGASTYFVSKGAAVTDRPKYIALADPFSTPGAVWTFESRGTDKYAIRNIESNYYFNSHTNGYDDFMATSWTESGTFDFSYASSKFSIKNTSVVIGTYSPGQYVGPWNGGSSVSSAQDVACNKTSENAPGFKIYAMSRSNYAKQYLSSATPSSSKDASFLLVNPNICQGGNTTDAVSGWTATGTTGNSHITQGTGDTRLEAWHWVSFSAERSQEITSLPSGWYSLTATVHNRDNTDAVLFISSTTSGEKTTTIPQIAGENPAGENRTTNQVYVTEDGTLTIGIKIENGGGTWFTGDNFRLTYYGDPLEDINAKITAVGALAYASSTKKPSTYIGTSASDAASHETSLISALRAYVESNALGEGVVGATNYTSSIAEPSCEATAVGDEHGTYRNNTWTCYNVRANGGQGYTNSAGTTKGYYFDSNGQFWNHNQWGASLEQTISDLPRGKYLLTVTSRSSGNLSSLYISGNGTRQSITNPNNVFGNGWDDTSVEFSVGNAGTAEIEFAGNNGGVSNKYFSADNFRLVRIGDLDAVTISETATSAPTAAVADVTLTRTLSASYWNTFSVPFNTAIPSGWAVKEFDSAGGNVINFKDASTIEAGKPYLVKPTSNVENPTFEGVTVVSTSGSTDGEGDYKFAAQIYNKSLATDGTIAYLAPDASIKKLTSGGIKGLRAYFIIPSNAEARIAFIDEGVTEIQELKTSMTEELKAEQYYNLRGQRVEKPTKGLYIVNGKKVVK